MDKRELRRAFKSEIDNLFKSPEQAESEFLRATRKRKFDDSGHSIQTQELPVNKEDPNKPRLVLRLCRLGDGDRIDCKKLSRFIHFSVFGSSIQKPNWVCLSNQRLLLQTLIIRINVEDDFFITTNMKFPNEFFEKRWIEMDSDINNRELFWNCIMNIQLTPLEQIRRKTEKMQKTSDQFGKPDKTHFVLTNAQLAERRFPFPGEENVVPTKRRYKKLSPSSPLYSVDCEMCETNIAFRELTRISIVDQQKNTILDTLVKPEGQITDYVTQYSGITPEMMNGVTTTLQDVQKAVQNILPPDAILVGHSLEHDLRAMKMSHPFCFDVGYSLNYTNGNLGLRNSLKNLTELFLGDQIQSELGHCSYEDAWAAMCLAQLKLEKGLMFGNTSHGWKYSEYAKNNGVAKEKVIGVQTVSLPCTDCSQPTVVGCTVINCRCRFVAGPSKCVKCLKEEKSVEGDFNWEDILDVSTEEETIPIESYLKKDKMKSVMCAFDTTILENQPTMPKKIRSKLPSNFSSCEAFVNNVISEMLNDSVILLEIDKANVKTPQEGAEDAAAESSEALNELLEKLVGATTKNALVLMIFSNVKQNILYARVK